MKAFGKILVIGLVVFGAVFAALNVDRMLNRPKPMGAENLDDFLSKTPTQPVRYEPTNTLPDFRDPVAKLAPCVVSVDRFQEIYDWFGDSRGVQNTGTGSGVIISADGYILTNNHVVAEGDQVKVRLTDERTFTAKVIGTDPRSDLAVLKIDAKNLTAATLGDSSNLVVGEWVIAIGNPLGYSNTVSVGVVSNLNRTLQTGQSSVLVDGIQTDAAINQGNSGGALANARGELIGINTAIVSNSGGNIGLGFAVPINRAKRVVKDIIDHGRVLYGTIGVTVYNAPGILESRSARRELASQHNAELPTKGLVIRAVDPDSPAGKLGLRNFDVLVRIDKTPLNLPIDLTKATMDKRPGDKVSLTYWSKGQEKTVTVSLAEPI